MESSVFLAEVVTWVTFSYPRWRVGFLQPSNHVTNEFRTSAVLRITSRSVLNSVGLLGGRQVDAARRKAPAIRFEQALESVASRPVSTWGGGVG